MVFALVLAHKHCAELNALISKPTINIAETATQLAQVAIQYVGIQKEHSHSPLPRFTLQRTWVSVQIKSLNLPFGYNQARLSRNT